jgi:hypothetical protein
VAILPAEYTVDASSAEEVLSRIPVPRESFDLDLGQRIVATHAAERGIPVLDLTPVFRAGGGSALYLHHDTHWNEAGRRLAAQALAPFVRGLLSEVKPEGS